MINSIAHWDGNRSVADHRRRRAVRFAGRWFTRLRSPVFYVAMILVLASLLFFRPVGFDYRSKIEDTLA